MTVFETGRSEPSTAPYGPDSHLSRSVFHGAFSAGEATRPDSYFQYHELTT